METHSSEVLLKPKLSLFDQDVVRLAAQAHDTWRSGRAVMPDGSYEPRLKPTTDETWITAHGGQTVVDIANRQYIDLPADHQADNKASATVALEEAYRVGFYGKGDYVGRNFLYFEHFINDSSSAIHIKWLGRNAAQASGAQRLPYEDLSPAERKKDQDIYTGAAAIVNEHIANGSLTVPHDMLFTWYMEHLEYLKSPEVANAYAGWQPLVGETYLVGNDRVHLNLDIAYDRIHLHGTYPLDLVAKLVRSLLYLRSDPLDDGLRNLGADEARRSRIDHFLAAAAVFDC